VSKVKVLIEGYAKEVKGGWLASSTTTLIESSGKKILVDPGINRGLLLKKLKQQRFSLKDIDIVFLTHYHPDHALLAGIFGHSKVMDVDTIYDKDKEEDYEGKIPGTEIKVLATPGHAHEHASLLLDTEKGKVAIAADLFWWTDDAKQDTQDLEALIKKDDPFVKDKKALQESRKLILEKADWIIPGHGEMFKNPLAK
jgi:glyoxylase-like metal-dependent hydrolase (beta-lactamase superfamily II)